MIKNLLLSYWLWGILLVVFIFLILKEDTVVKDLSTYEKHQMILKDVNFSQMENGFEFARLYADTCEMDDNKNNMNASNVRVIFFKEDVATWTGRLISEQGLKNRFEGKFWGDVRAWNTDNERFRTDEVHYFINRKEVHTSSPITAWKDDAVLTGIGFRYNTQTKEAFVHQNVLIRIWENASDSQKVTATPTGEIDGVPIAPPLSLLNMPIRTISEVSSASADMASDTDAVVSAASVAENLTATHTVKEIEP